MQSLVAFFGTIGKPSTRQCAQFANFQPREKIIEFRFSLEIKF
jgi:hypothetical protein